MTKAQDTLDKKALAAQYGFDLAFLKHHPDLDKLLNDAIKKSYSDAEFVAQLRGTHWFKSASDSQRQWEVLQSSDPATAHARLLARIADVSQVAGKSGVTASADYLHKIARMSLGMGWNDAQLSQHLAAAFKYDSDTAYKGAAGDTIDAVKKIANAYLVPVSDATIQKWTRSVIAGTATEDDFSQWAAQQAKSLMPALSKQIDAGMTVQDLIDPYRETAARLLEVSPDSIDFSQTKWRKAVDNVDPKTNDRAMLSLTDWEKTLRTDPTYGYDKTTQARTDSASFQAKLAQTFGAM